MDEYDFSGLGLMGGSAADPWSGVPYDAGATYTGDSQVPGTTTRGYSGYTPSSTDGGVSVGDGTATDSGSDSGSIFGSLGGGQQQGKGLMGALQGAQKYMQQSQPQQQQQAPTPAQHIQAIAQKYGVDFKTAMMLYHLMAPPSDNPIAPTSMLGSTSNLMPRSVMPGSIGGGGQGQQLPMLANGGPLRAGQPAIVGERGPEIFQPNMPGTIVPIMPPRWGGRTGL